MGGDNNSILPPALPNIIGTLEGTTITPHTGAFQLNEILQAGAWSGNYDVLKGTFNANRCSPIYQDDCKTVQPPAFMLLPQIKF